MVDTHTSGKQKGKITDTDSTKVNYPHKCLTNKEIPAIIQGVIPPVNQTNADKVATSVRVLYVLCAILHKEIFTGASRSAAGVLKVPLVVNWKDASGTIPQNINTVRMPPRTTTPVWNSTGPSVPPINIGIQKIKGPRRPIIPQEIRNPEPLTDSINRINDKHRYPDPSWSKVIGIKTFTNESADIYARGRMNFWSDTILSESPNFMDLGLSTFNKTDELGSVVVPTARIGRPEDGSNWLLPGHDISEATADIVNRTKANNHYILKVNLKLEEKNGRSRFGRQNDPMSRPTLDSTSLVTNTTNRKTSPINSIPVGTKTPEHTPLTRLTEFPDQNKKAHIPGDLDTDPSSSDLSSKKSNLLNDSNYSKS